MSKSSTTQSFSKLGFILAAAGSAIGLGNIWRLPAQVFQYGGGTFLFTYFFICLTFGLGVLIAELAIGRYLGPDYLKAAPAKLKEHNKSSGLSSILYLAGIPSILILSFYFVVCGWVLYFLTQTVIGGISYSPEVGTANYYEGIFGNLITNDFQVLIYMAIFVALTALINFKGLINGIERANFIMLPALFIILILMIIRSVTMPGALEGVKYIFSFDFNLITLETIIAALKQSFFTLSLGMCVMITFSASSDKTMNLRSTALYTVLLGSGIGLFTSLLIVPAAFSVNYDLNAGPSLTFITLPNIFAGLPFGILFATLFFLVMMMAAITSTISLYEVATNVLKTLLKITRNQTITLLFILFVILSSIQVYSFTSLSGVHIGKLGIFDFSSNLADLGLVFFGLWSCIFVSYIFGKKAIYDELSNQNSLPFGSFSIWYVFVKYISPIVLGVLIYLSFINLF